ncbi:MAG: helix-turn-helix domain-containing protein [Proteobacteria bacterium]|nr:helix-turn-helix domain-containing protein [Pseudomonadota bacterium]
MTAGWFRPRDAAAYVGVSLRTLNMWLKAGLPHSRVKGCVLIRRESLDSYLESFSVETRDAQVDRLVDDVLRGLR